MRIEAITFKEPIYTRRSSFNHDYDITLNEITKDSNNNAFSDKGYALALLDRLELYGFHEKQLFLEYQLKQSEKPIRWLLDFERLVEINNWKSGFEFINFRKETLKKTHSIISVLFKNIEHDDLLSVEKSENNHQQNNEVIFNSTEACEYLNISKSTLYKLTSDKAIAFYKPNGKNMYFKKESLDAYITRTKQISNSELETQTNDYISRNWKP